MNKINFLNNDDVKVFTQFVADAWQNGLDFNVGIKQKGQQVDYIHANNLKEVLKNYSWQYSIDVQFDIPDEIPRKGNKLIQSESLLNYVQNMLIVDGEINTNIFVLRTATEITLKWGGVFTKGNKNKVTDISYDLKKDYDEVLIKWKGINDNNADFTSIDNFGFTSNAGFTKIYSLLLSDFVIYDSRVSVALAYMIEKCFGENIPEFLRIYIPASRVADSTKRKVNNFFTSTYQKDSRHFYSNVITSILLNESLRLINDQNLKLRDLEAALFMMGYDIRPNIFKPIAE